MELTRRLKPIYIHRDISELERTFQAYNAHLWGLIRFTIVDTNLRDGREFNAWKKEKGKTLREEYQMETELPSFDWQKFELCLKYFRSWRKIVLRRQAAMRSGIEEGWTRQYANQSEGGKSILPRRQSSPSEGPRS